MKRLRLSLPTAVATLFISFSGLLVGAEGAMMVSGRDAEILRRFDRNGDGRIDDDERADAYEAMRRERSERQTSGPVINAARREEFRQRFFARFDLDHDGRIDDAERANATRMLGETRRGQASALRDELMQLFDANRDGKLDDTEKAALTEFLAASQGKGSEGGAALRADLVRRMDRNRDGRVDEKELAAAESMLRARLQTNPARLRQFDLNGNGKIDDDEWPAARDQLMRWLNEPAPAAISSERMKEIEQDLRQRREGRSMPSR
jgi:Ca2+-binding EF-hand superfamily protein